MGQQIQNFEQIMTETFFKYSKKVLPIDENYLDWLIDYFRRQRQNQTEKSLVTGYFYNVNSNLNYIDQKKFFLGFYHFLLLAGLKRLLQKFFGNNPILLFHLE